MTALSGSRERNTAKMEILIGIAVAGLLFGLRQDSMRSEFLRKHGSQIKEENETIADAWRASNPREKKLVVKRTFKPPGLLSPTVRMRKKFKRDKRG